MSSEKNQHKKGKQHISELRRDLVTGNWVLIAKSRGKRPGHHKAEKEEEDPIETCPFEDPEKSGNAAPTLINSGKGGEDWSLQVIPNKYPAFSGGGCPIITKRGPYSVQAGFGFHEVIITRDHSKHLGLLSSGKAAEVFMAYKKRYLDLEDEECVKYISIFHNHGKRAGASLTHPHSQLIAIPVLPADIERSLSGSNLFLRKNGKCVHCAMLEREREDKKRIVSENKDFIAVCPFISRDAYEVRIFPQKHEAHFENASNEKIESLAEIFRDVLFRLYEKLDNPPYNFYLHTAPITPEYYKNKYDQYHWHFEIRPKLETGAGFELSTGLEIAVVEPEEAAKSLRRA